MSDLPRFKVNGADREGPTWPRLERWLKAHLAELREENDKTSLGAEETARLRGRIEEVKWLLQAAEEDPPPLPIGG